MARSPIGHDVARIRPTASFGTLALTLLLMACNLPTEVEGGANTNDRSDGGNDGAVLLTGSMVLSPPTASTSYGLMQRNTVSVFVDFEAQTAHELDYMVNRWVFSPEGDVGYSVIDNDLVALELPKLTEFWRTPVTSGTVGFLRVSDDGRTLIMANGLDGKVVDAATGNVRSTFAVGKPEDVAFLPDGKYALVVGQTKWVDHLPATPVLQVDLVTGDTTAIEVPNCAAPIVVLPTGKRALLSPTFCEEGVASTANKTWTNPDPVSVIDLQTDGPHFVKNLPGFGPVALTPDGERAVAYLDVQRIDPAMFDDPTQIPAADGPRYHIMVINPSTLEFSLTAIGNALPRFAMARDGNALLVDASVQVVRSAAVNVDATLSYKNNQLSGSLDVDVSVFTRNAPFGTFDLQQLTFTPFKGPAASLDRFVLPSSGLYAFTLKRTADGLGGDLYRIDFATATTEALGRSLRDIGLLPDGKTMVLRIRSSPLHVTSGVRLQEEYCLSSDGKTCSATIAFTSRLVFQSEYCSNPANYHDC